MQTRVTRFLERKEKNRGWNGSKIVHAKKKKKISDRCSFTWNRVCQHVLPFLSPPLFCFLFPRKQLDREINFTWQSSNYRHIWPTKLPRINKVRQMFKYLMSWAKKEIKKKVKRKSRKVISEIKKKKRWIKEGSKDRWKNCSSNGNAESTKAVISHALISSNSWSRQTS